MKQKKSTSFKKLARSLLLIIVGFQVLYFYSAFLEGRYSTIRLTVVEKEENIRFRHPLYTICTIMADSGNINHPKETLESVMGKSSPWFPTATFFTIANSPSLKNVTKFTTWLKTRDQSKKRRQVLTPCYTFQVHHEVTPGSEMGRVKSP